MHRLPLPSGFAESKPHQVLSPCEGPSAPDKILPHWIQLVPYGLNQPQHHTDFSLLSLNNLQESYSTNSHQARPAQDFRTAWDTAAFLPESPCLAPNKTVRQARCGSKAVLAESYRQTMIVRSYQPQKHVICGFLFYSSQPQKRCDLWSALCLQNEASQPPTSSFRDKPRL